MRPHSAPRKLSGAVLFSLLLNFSFFGTSGVPIFDPRERDCGLTRYDCKPNWRGFLGV